jgi:hypothetical protein
MPFNQLKTYNQLLEIVHFSTRERGTSLKGIFNRDISENKNFKNEIKVYPTPASTHVTIESEDKSLKLSEVLLFDNNGKLQSIKVQRSTDGFQINRGALKAGTYYIQLGQKVSKVIFID